MIHDLAAEFFIAGDVYDAILNGKEIITSRDGIMEPIVAEVGALRPWSAADIEYG
jgi:hypothetical protein